MKKTILTLFAIALMGAATTGCSGEYTCECTTVDSSGFLPTTTVEGIIEGKRADAKAECEGGSASVGSLTTTCKLK